MISFAKIGLKHDINGKESRGGLLVKSDTGFKVLQRVRDPEVFDALKESYLPLLYREDVQEHKLIHNAAKYHSFDLVKYFHNLDPCCLFNRRNNLNILPIHFAIRRGKSDDSMKISQYLLQQSNEDIDSLFETMLGPDTDESILDIWVKKWGRQDAWNCIESALSTS